jgi:hypothetical protein
MTVSFCLESVTIVGTLWNDLRFEDLVVAVEEEVVVVVAEEVVAAAVKVEVEEEAPSSIDGCPFCDHSLLHHQSQIAAVVISED